MLLCSELLGDKNENLKFWYQLKCIWQTFIVLDDLVTWYGHDNHSLNPSHQTILSLGVPLCFLWLLSSYLPCSICLQRSLILCSTDKKRQPAPQWQPYQLSCELIALTPLTSGEPKPEFINSTESVCYNDGEIRFIPFFGQFKICWDPPWDR